MKQFCKKEQCPLFEKACVKVLTTQANGILEAQNKLMKYGLPDYGWLADYVQYASTATDAPEVFHVFGGLSALSVMVGRNVYLPFGDDNIYPNTWIVLVAKSSFFHKSTALRIPQRLVRACNEKRILPDEFSPEALFGGLQSNPIGLFIWSEMKSALDYLNRSYMVGTKEFLTDIYDCPPVRTRVLKEKPIAIHEPALSILAATTVDWLMSGIKGGDIGGGFTARFVFVPAMAKTRDIALPEPTDKVAQNKLVQRLQACSNVKGMVDISKVRRMYEDWYYANMEELKSDPQAEMMASFFTRLTIYTLKFAMLLELSKTLDVVISEETMKQAIAITEYLKESFRYLIAREFHTTREGRELEKVYRLIESKPGSTYRDLLQRSHMQAKTFQPLLQTLVQSGRVKQNDKIYMPGC
jgi:hypothetical protein